MQDPETETFHESPKKMRTAVNGPDKDKWLPSMKRELKAMKDKDVWEEVTTLPRGKYWRSSYSLIFRFGKDEIDNTNKYCKSEQERTTPTEQEQT